MTGIPRHRLMEIFKSHLVHVDFLRWNAPRWIVGTKKVYKVRRSKKFDSEQEALDMLKISILEDLENSLTDEERKNITEEDRKVYSELVYTSGEFEKEFLPF